MELEREEFCISNIILWVWDLKNSKKRAADVAGQQELTP